MRRRTALAAALLAGAVLVTCKGPTAVRGEGPPTERVATIADRFEIAKRSTVLIVGEGTDSSGNAVQWIGSGVTVRPRLVATAKHVVAPEGVVVQRIHVMVDADIPAQAANMTTNLGAVRWMHPDAAVDVALLDVPGLRAPSVALANALARSGDEVFIVGHPLSDGSGLRPFIGSGVIAGEVGTLASWSYRLDVIVNQGNSGGALISRDAGELLGIVYAKHKPRLRQNLQNLRASPPRAEIVMGGLPIAGTLREIILDMEDTIQLGYGYAVPVAAFAGQLPPP